MKPSARRRINVLVLATALLSLSCAGPRYDLVSSTPSRVTGPSDRVVGVVRVKAPWYAASVFIRGKFRSAVPEYEAKRALETKYFTIADDGRFGGIYLWSTRADADAFRSIAEHVRDLEGLVRGAALTGNAQVGFVALWATRDLAVRAVSPEALAGRERGWGLERGEVTFFDAPVLIDASLREPTPPG
jgi:hypothetical protein